MIIMGSVLTQDITNSYSQLNEMTCFIQPTDVDSVSDPVAPTPSYEPTENLIHHE